VHLCLPSFLLCRSDNAILYSSYGCFVCHWSFLFPFSFTSLPPICPSRSRFASSTTIDSLIPVFFLKSVPFFQRRFDSSGDFPTTSSQMPQTSLSSRLPYLLDRVLFQQNLGLPDGLLPAPTETGALPASLSLLVFFPLCLCVRSPFHPLPHVPFLLFALPRCIYGLASLPV